MTPPENTTARAPSSARIFWTIDHYDETCTYRSKNPCNEDVTPPVE
jgi:hypothetical protein